MEEHRSDGPTTFSTTTLSIAIRNKTLIELDTAKLSVMYAECRKQAHYAECRYAEGPGADYTPVPGNISLVLP